MECVSFHNFSSSALLDDVSGSWGMSFNSAASSSTTVVDAGSSSTGALALLCKMLETEACSFSLAVSSINDATLRPERASHARMNPVATSNPKVRYVQGRRLFPRPALPGRGLRLNLGIRPTAALQHQLISRQQGPIRLLPDQPKRGNSSCYGIAACPRLVKRIASRVMHALPVRARRSSVANRRSCSCCLVPVHSFHASWQRALDSVQLLLWTCGAKSVCIAVGLS